MEQGRVDWADGSTRQAKSGRDLHLQPEEGEQ